MSKTLEKPVAYKSPLHEMTQTTPTCLWNDSATLSELTYSIEHGAVGATCNPVIVLDALKKEAHLWNDRIRALAVEMPTATEEEIGWRLVEEISAKRSELLRPAFEQHQGPEWPALDSNGSALLSQSSRSAGAGAALQCLSAEHDREDSRDPGWHRCDRGGDVSRHQHQRHRLLRPAAMYCGGRSHGARASNGGRRKAMTYPGWARFARSWAADWTIG